MSVYNIIINILHAIFLNEKVFVIDKEKIYNDFKNNVLLIEKKIDESDDNGKLHNSISTVLLLLKQDGVYRLLPGDELSFRDLYKLNGYFMDTIINEGWYLKISQLNEFNSNINDEYVDILVANANYLNKELLNNSNFEYTYNKNIRDKINEEYQYILNNYQKFSFLILELSNKIGDNNVKNS